MTDDDVNDDGDGATGDDNDDDGDGATGCDNEDGPPIEVEVIQRTGPQIITWLHKLHLGVRMAKARRATKLTMMSTVQRAMASTD